MSGRWSRAWPLAFALLSSCAYFNGMYNAKKYAHDAEHSEQEGRTSEARDRWAQAALHADSLVVHHPHSRWAEEARLIQGTALIHVEDYSNAVVVLTEAVAAARRRDDKLHAMLLLGHANFAMRLDQDAGPPLDSAATADDPRVRSAALLWRGRLELARGASAAALNDFRASREPGVGLWRARAAFRLGDPAAAADWLDEAAVTTAYSETDWLPLLDTLADAGLPARASRLERTLAARRGLGTGEQSRLVLGECDRVAGRGDDSAASTCYAEAAALAPDSMESRIATVRLSRLRLRDAQDDSTVEDIRSTLGRIAEQGGSAAREADPVVHQLQVLAELTVGDPSPGADARWFAGAELARDSLGMMRWAAARFAAMVDRFPDSPWTPKGLVAAIDAGYPAADSLRALLTSRYPDSPYTIVADGRDAPRYAVLEDSLRSLLSNGVSERPPGASPEAGPATDEGRGPRRPVPGRPASRPTPAAPGTRNPQP